MSQPLPSSLADKLNAFAARERSVTLGRGLARAFLVFAIGLLLGALAVWLLKPSLPGRIACTAAVLGATLFVLVRDVLRHALRKTTVSETAARFEKAAGGTLRDRLTSAVDFASAPPSDASAWMFEKTISLAAAEIAPLDPNTLIDAAPLRKARRSALIAGGFLLACVAFFPSRLWVVLSPSSPAFVVDTTRLAVTPGNISVPVGSSLEIKALFENAPETPVLSVIWEDGFSEELPMTRSGQSSRYERPIPRVARAFRYRVTVGETASPEYTVSIITAPVLESLTLEITPPEYLKQKAREVKGGSAEILAGSRVKVKASLSGSAAKAVELLPAKADPMPMALAQHLATLELAPTADLSYSLRFVGQNEAEAISTETWNLRIVTDRAPSVVLAGVGLDTGLIGTGEALLLDVEAHDDFGVARVELVAVVNGLEVRKLLETKEKPSVIKSGETRLGQSALDLPDLGAQLGDEIVLHAEVVDAGGLKTLSKEVKLTVLEPSVAETARLARRLRAVLLETDQAVVSFREARARWAGFLRTRNTRGEEAVADLGQVRLSALRMAEKLKEAAVLLDAERRDTRHRIAPYLADLSVAMTAWADAQHRIVDDALTAAAADPEDEAVMLRCRNIMEKASEELAVQRMRVAVAPACLESECLVAVSEASRGAFRRALPVVAQARGWNLESRPGLDVSFHRGRDFGVEPSGKRVEWPEFENRDAPSLGQTNWCARYTGEVRVAEDGAWEFTVTANDGVKVFVDGKSILPGEAWGDGGLRIWKGSPTLSAGWHAFAIEFFQSNGPNRLQLQVARPGKPPAAISRGDLRTVSPLAGKPPAEGLTPAMAFASASRLPQALQSVTGVIAELERWLTDVPMESLFRLAEDRRHFSADLEALLPTFSSWEGYDAVAAQGYGDVLVNTAGDAHRLLKERWEHESWQVRRLATFAEMRVPLQALKNAADKLRPLENDRRTTQSQEKRAKEATVAQAWAKELTEATRETAKQLFEDARDSSLPLAQRAEALETSLKLEKEATELAAKIQDTVKDRAADERVSEPLQRATEKLSDLLDKENKLERVQNETKLADPAREALRDLAKKDAEGVKEAVDAVADEQRRQRRPEDAAALEKAAEKPDGKELADRLKDLAQKRNQQADSIGEALPPPLHEAADQAKKDGAPSPENTEALAKARLGLALEAERLAKANLPKTAEAYRDLGNKLGEALAEPEKVTGDQLKPIANKASELVNEKNKEAQERALANAGQPPGEDASPASPETPEQAEAADLAQQLSELAGEVSDAKHSKSKRQPARDKLDPLAKSETPAASEARQAAAEAASDAAAQIDAAPESSDAFQQASKTLAEAAASLRLQKPSAQAAAAAEAAEKQMAAQKGEPGEGDKPGEPGQDAKPGKGKKPGSKPGDDDYARQAGQGMSAKELAAKQQAAWAALRSKLPDAVKGGDLERFDEEQQEAIRAYFKRLADAP